MEEEWTEMDDFRFEVGRLYNEYLEETENRNPSYGEYAYIENLDEQGLNDMYEELLEVLENE